MGSEMCIRDRLVSCALVMSTKSPVIPGHTQNKMRTKGPVAMAANQNSGKHAMDTMHEHMDESRGRMKGRTEEWTVGNGWMEWSGERMNGRMESMFDCGMDGCLGEKKENESIFGLILGAGRTNKKETQ